MKAANRPNLHTCLVNYMLSICTVLMVCSLVALSAAAALLETSLPYCTIRCQIWLCRLKTVTYSYRSQHPVWRNEAIYMEVVTYGPIVFAWQSVSPRDVDLGYYVSRQL